MSKSDFIAALKKLKQPVISKTGRASYSNLELRENILHFKRDMKNTNWQINIDELYEAYVEMETINTLTIQEHVKGRVYSPACAILIGMKLYDTAGNRT